MYYVRMKPTTFAIVMAMVMAILMPVRASAQALNLGADYPLDRWPLQEVEGRLEVLKAELETMYRKYNVEIDALSWEYTGSLLGSSATEGSDFLPSDALDARDRLVYQIDYLYSLRDLHMRRQAWQAEKVTLEREITRQRRDRVELRQMESNERKFAEFDRLLKQSSRVMLCGALGRGPLAEKVTGASGVYEGPKVIHGTALWSDLIFWPGVRSASQEPMNTLDRVRNKLIRGTAESYASQMSKRADDSPDGQKRYYRDQVEFANSIRDALDAGDRAKIDSIRLKRARFLIEDLFQPVKEPVRSVQTPVRSEKPGVVPSTDAPRGNAPKFFDIKDAGRLVGRAIDLDQCDAEQLQLRKAACDATLAELSSKDISDVNVEDLKLARRMHVQSLLSDVLARRIGECRDVRAKLAKMEAENLKAKQVGISPPHENSIKQCREELAMKKTALWWSTSSTLKNTVSLNDHILPRFNNSIDELAEHDTSIAGVRISVPSLLAYQHLGMPYAGFMKPDKAMIEHHEKQMLKLADAQDQPSKVNMLLLKEELELARKIQAWQQKGGAGNASLAECEALDAILRPMIEGLLEGFFDPAP